MMMVMRRFIDLIGPFLLLATCVSFETTRLTTSAFSLSLVKKKQPPLLRLLGPIPPSPPRLSSSPLEESLPLHASTTTATSSDAPNRRTVLSKWQSLAVRLGMMLFVTGMCVALPVTLLPQLLLYKMRLISKTQKEMLALRTTQFCARFLLRLIPFCKLETLPGIRGTDDGQPPPPPQPAVWVCNHTSMLDIFMLCVADKKARGNQRRPIKIVYRKALEANPLSKLFFRQAGFIPIVQIVDENGYVVNDDNNNSYDASYFKKFVKDCKHAFKEGFDVGVMPEGKVNPTTEDGVLPPFAGAFSMAKMSHRPIRFMALYGIDKLWHCNRGMVCSNRNVKVRCYPNECYFQSPEQFVAAFTNVVGYFGKTGEDMPKEDLEYWLSGQQKENKNASSAG